MRDHPLTPMRDLNLVRVLGRQTKRHVGLVPHQTVRLGAVAMAQAFDRLKREGIAYAIVDALDNSDLEALGEASSGLTAGDRRFRSGARASRKFSKAGPITRADSGQAISYIGWTGSVVLAGSCSAATLAQVERMKQKHPAYAVTAEALASNFDEEVSRAIEFALERLPEGPVIVYSSAAPAVVAQVQARIGRDAAGSMIETAMGKIAQSLAAKECRRFRGGGW